MAHACVDGSYLYIYVYTRDEREQLFSRLLEYVRWIVGEGYIELIG